MAFHGMYTEVMRPQGLDNHIGLYLSEPPGPDAGPGRTVRLFFLRQAGLDFSERDRALLTLLRPHLQQAYHDAERRRSPVPNLTARQWDLLHLVAGGRSNFQIARQLGLSEGTVRTHLENIYARLNVSNRTAAVVRAFPDRVPEQVLDRLGMATDRSGSAAVEDLPACDGSRHSACRSAAILISRVESAEWHLRASAPSHA
jgi:DNA-binding CsgD family transcriptional regulator